MKSAAGLRCSWTSSDRCLCSHRFHSTQVLDVTGFLKYAVQAAAMFETRFNSVERLMAYFELPQEAPRLIEATKCAVVHSILAWADC